MLFCWFLHRLFNILLLACVGLYNQITFVWFVFVTLFLLKFVLLFALLHCVQCTWTNNTQSYIRIHDNNLNTFFCVFTKTSSFNTCFVIFQLLWTRNANHFHFSFCFVSFKKDKKNNGEHFRLLFVFEISSCEMQQKKWYENSENHGAIFSHGNFIEILVSVWCKAPHKYYTNICVKFS